MRLGDLLAEPSLGLALRTGSADAAARPVLGAAVIEVEAPTRWIAPNWVLLTAGVRLEQVSEQELRVLVADCEAAGVAALGFGIGPVFDELPAALVAEGEAREYPIFAVPAGTPFRSVVRFVDAAVMGDEAPLFRRLSSLQRFVVDALRDPEPERAMVERLARFMDASVAVLGPTGEPEIAHGHAPVDALWRTIPADVPAVAEAEADGWHAVAAPLAAGPDEPPRWLLLASPRDGFVGTLAKRAAEMTAPLLVAVERLREVARDQELAVRGALLDELLAADDARDLASLAARAAAFDLDFGAPARVVLVRAGEPALVREALHRTGAPHLVSERGAVVVALVQGADPAAALAGVADVVAGVGREIAGIAAVRESLRDAQLALERSAPGRVVAYEQFDLGTLLLSDAAPERLEPKVEALISVLREHPSLQEALVAYFDHDLDVGAAAAQLSLHPNSLRYRLARIEDLLGCSLKRPATIADLHIALLADARTRGARF